LQFATFHFFRREKKRGWQKNTTKVSEMLDFATKDMPTNEGKEPSYDKRIALQGGNFKIFVLY
jgi:hypothetical protein